MNAANIFGAGANNKADDGNEEIDEWPELHKAIVEVKKLWAMLVRVLLSAKAVDEMQGGRRFGLPVRLLNFSKLSMARLIITVPGPTIKATPAFYKNS